MNMIVPAIVRRNLEGGRIESVVVIVTVIEVIGSARGSGNVVVSEIEKETRIGEGTMMMIILLRRRVRGGLLKKARGRRVADGETE